MSSLVFWFIWEVFQFLHQEGSEFQGSHCAAFCWSSHPLFLLWCFQSFWACSSVLSEWTVSHMKPSGGFPHSWLIPLNMLWFNSRLTPPWSFYSNILGIFLRHVPFPRCWRKCFITSWFFYSCQTFLRCSSQGLRNITALSQFCLKFSMSSGERGGNSLLRGFFPAYNKKVFVFAPAMQSPRPCPLNMVCLRAPYSVLFFSPSISWHWALFCIILSA